MSNKNIAKLNDREIKLDVNISRVVSSLIIESGCTISKYTHRHSILSNDDEVFEEVFLRR